MQQRAARTRELGVDRLAHERVGEDGAAGLLADQLRGERGVERLDERLARQPAGRASTSRSQLADRRRRASRRTSPAGSPSRSSRRASTSRTPSGTPGAADSQAGAGPPRRRTGCRRSRSHTEPVSAPGASAPSHAVTSASTSRCRGRRARRADEAVAAQVGQQGAERRPPSSSVAGRGEDRAPARAGRARGGAAAAASGGRPSAGRRARGARAPGRRAGQQRGRRLEQAVALASRVARGGRAERRQPVGLVGDEARRARRRAAGRAALARAVSQVRPQRLGERLVRRDRVLVGAAVEDGRPALVSRARELGRQAGLADPRLPGDHDRAGARRPALLPRVADHPRRRGAAHERAAMAPRQRRRQRQRLAAQLRHERPRLLGRLDPQLAPQHRRADARTRRAPRRRRPSRPAGGSARGGRPRPADRPRSARA